MSWFPLPESLLYGNDEWHRLTITAKAMLLACISEANASTETGSFYRGNDDWRCRLWSKLDRGRKMPISRNTLSAARDQLCSVTGGLVFTAGRRTGDFSLASEYSVSDELCRPGNIQGHFAQMPRYMFENILWRWGCHTAIAYAYISAEYWRNRGRYADRNYFFVSLGELQRETGLRDFYQHIETLHSQFIFKGGGHLFKFEGHRRITFREWETADEKSNSANDAAREKDIQQRAKQLTVERELSRVNA